DHLGKPLVAAGARAVSVNPDGSRALLLFSMNEYAFSWTGLDYALRFRLAGMLATSPAGPLHPLPFLLHDLPAPRYGGSLGSCLELWNLESGKKLSRWAQFTERVTSFQFSPDGRRAVVGRLPRFNPDDHRFVVGRSSSWRGIQVRDVSTGRIERLF